MSAAKQDFSLAAIAASFALLAALAAGCGLPKEVANPNPPVNPPPEKEKPVTPTTPVKPEEKPVTPKPADPPMPLAPTTTTPTTQTELPMIAGRSLAEWISEAGSDDERLRQKANEKLEGLGAKRGEYLVTALSHSTDTVRRGAAFVLLGDFDPQKPEQVKFFLKALDDSDRRVRDIAMQALGRLDAGPLAVAEEALLRRLKDPQESAAIRGDAARRISRIGTAAKASVPVLADRAQNDADPKVRLACLYSLQKVASSPGEVFPALLVALEKDRDAEVRRTAAKRLGDLGADASEAIPALASILGSTEPELAVTAAEALKKIGRGAVPELIKQLSSPRTEAKLRAIAVLVQFGPGAKEALPALRILAEKGEPAIRGEATDAISRIAPAPM